MAFNAGTATGKLELDTAGFVKGIQAASASAQGLFAQARNLAGALAKVGAAFAVTGITAAVGAIGGAVAKGIESQRDYEESLARLQATFANLGPSFAGAAQKVEEFAGAIERATGLDDQKIFGVAGALAQAGVAANNLESATRTVLDFSVATGTDAEAAAKKFAAALAGNAGALSRYIPEVKALTAEQLKAGAAFDVVGEKVKGQAAAFGETFTGRIERLKASLDDLFKRLGAAATEAFGPLVTELQGVFDVLTDSLGSGTQGFSALQQAAQSAATAVAQSFSFLVDLGLRLTSSFQFAAGVVAQIGATINTVGAAVQSTLNAFEGGIVLLLGRFAELLSKIAETVPGLQAASGPLAQLAQSARDYAQKLSDGNDAAQALAAESQKNADALFTAATRATALRSAFETARNAGAGLVGQTQALVGATGAAKEKVEGLKTATQSAVPPASNLAMTFKRADDAAKSARDTLKSVTNETENAAGAAADFADNLANAADAAGSISIGGGSGGGGASSGGRDDRTISQQFGRQSSSRSLDFSDPFRAVAEANRAFDDLGRIQFGAKRADTGAAPLNAQAAFAQAVRREAEAAVARAEAEFVAGVINELNSGGFQDPAERNRIVRARLAEARRFGVVPTFDSRAGGAMIRGF
jgi:hypothetical protein